LAVVAACAEGESRFTGLHTLRIKETDRLKAIHQELAKVGIESRFGDDWLTVQGGNVRPARISTYDDHRMAMSFAMLGGILPDLEIEDPDVVTKSFPDFWGQLERVGVAYEEL
jgi:3-phosphoshikimate 1-carboxyvinyltransferase